jgi:hypothetical protein
MALMAAAMAEEWEWAVSGDGGEKALPATAPPPSDAVTWDHVSRCIHKAARGMGRREFDALPDSAMLCVGPAAPDGAGGYTTLMAGEPCWSDWEGGGVR